jgi:hypothetical protein
MRTFWIVFLFIVLCIVIFGGILLYTFSKGADYLPQISFSIPNDYKNLFSDSAKKELVVEASYSSPGRNCFAILNYKQQYEIIAYKFSGQRRGTLKDILKQDLKGDKRTVFSKFNVIKRSNIKITYSYDSVPATKNIIVIFYGDTVNSLVGNDSIYEAKFRLRRIAFRYDFAAPADINFENAKVNSDQIPVELLFIKKDGSLFFVIVSAKTNDADLNTNVFTHLIETN